MEIVQIPISNLRADKDWNPRTSYEDIDSLANDIATKGLISPLVVRQVKDKPNSFSLVVGFRRYYALKKIAKDSPSQTVMVPCQVFEGSEVEASLLNLRENVQRSDLTTYELALQCAKLKKTHNLSGADVATAIGKERNYINKLVGCLDRLIPEVTVAWSDNHHPAHALCTIPELSRLSSMEPEAQAKVWEEKQGFVPAGPREENSGSSTPSEEKIRRPSAIRVAESIVALKSVDLDPVIAKAMIVALKWSLGIGPNGKASKALRFEKTTIYDPSKPESDTEK